MGLFITQHSKIRNPALLVFLLLNISCVNKSVLQNGYFFKFKISISNKITRPTIINGYYGTMNRYLAGPGSAPQPVRNHILLYELEHKEAIENAAVQKNGTIFYDLKNLRKADVKPKFIIVPNRKGFYQIDTNNKSYCVLIRAKRNLGYFSGGAAMLQKLSNEVRELEMRIDY